MKNKYMIIGLTGQSGSGKSTVSKMLKKAGLHIIDADEIARDVMENNILCRSLIKQNFSAAIKDDEIVRKIIADIVFNDNDKLNLINRIMHPFIIYETLLKISELKYDKSIKYIVFDAPQLFESGANAFCDYIISVVAYKETRIKRIVERDGITLNEAKARVSSQLDMNYFMKNSDFVLRNNDDINSLAEKVSSMLEFEFRITTEPKDLL